MPNTTVLPVNYQDDILDATMGGKRRYEETRNSDGTLSIEDVSAYDQVGTNFGAKDINDTNRAINEINSSRILTLDEIALVTEEGFYVDALAVATLTNMNADNAGAHNSRYRGKYLGASVTSAQWAAISAGTFEDLYIGDYWTINGINYRIAAFDYYYKTGDTACTKHHVTLVPDTNMYPAAMNSTNITTGAYVGSEMYATNLASAKSTINSAFGETHILNHRQLFSHAVADGYESAGGWYDSTVDLMNEINVYGCKILGNVMHGTNIPYNYTIDKSQYPLFAFRPDIISNRQWFWLRDVASAAYFAYVRGNGNADINYASAAGGVRPAFSIS